MYLENILEPEPSSHPTLVTSSAHAFQSNLHMVQRGPNKTKVRCFQDSKPTKGFSIFPVPPGCAPCPLTLDLGLAFAHSHLPPSHSPHPSSCFFPYGTCVPKIRCTLAICFAAMSDPVRVGQSWGPAEHGHSGGRCCMNQFILHYLLFFFCS